MQHSVAIASAKKTSPCVNCCHEYKSLITVYHHFAQYYGPKPPNVKSVTEWYVKIKDTDSVCHDPRCRRRNVSAAKMDLVHRAFKQNL